jgi:signal transduction histidine kinase
LGAVLISLYSRREWTDGDQTYLQEINSFITQILQHPGRVSALEAQLTNTLREVENLQAHQEALQTESTQELSQAESMAALVATYEEAQATIERLEAEIETLRQTTHIVSSDGSITPQELNIIEGELRLTLEEVAHLRTALAEADQKIQALETTLSLSTSSKEQAELAASIAQELRQPLSSILGYTELLLSESVGILGALQRQFLDRIKGSTERMATLVEDLVNLEMIDEHAFEVTSESIELNAIVNETITYLDEVLKEKNISLNLELPELILKLYADRDAIEQVLIHLLQNATVASPEGSEIALKAQVEVGDDELDYVLLQVSDMGDGIPADDLPRVFSSLYRTDSTNIQGMGNTGIELSIVKTLVEAHSGRIWVDSKPGIGSTFSILLPVSTATVLTPVDD